MISAKVKARVEAVIHIFLVTEKTASEEKKKRKERNILWYQLGRQSTQLKFPK